MSARLVVRPEAEAELFAARDWYDNQRVGLGQEFVNEVRETVSEVATRPNGLLRVDVRTRRTRRHEIEPVIHQIVRWNGTLYLATTDGLYAPAAIG